MPVQPDQPTALINYNTDQFTDPVTGATVHDDGSDFYLCQANGIVYFKQRSKSGQYYSRVGNYLSYQITLIPRGVPSTLVGCVTLDGTTAYIDGNGFWCVVP